LTCAGIASSQGIGDSVLAALNRPPELEEEQAVIVHMADTLISNTTSDSIKSIVYVDSRIDLYRWTSVIKDRNGCIRTLSDRDLQSGGFEQSVCVGVFMFSNSALFAKLLRLETYGLRDTIEPFFRAIENYSIRLPVELELTNVWHDFGHVDSYYEAKLSFQNLRHFNTLTYDAARGLVTKSSEKREEFRHQVRWFKQVPNEIAPFLPRIYELDDGASPFITMEMLSIPTLSDLYVNKRLDLGAWFNVATKIQAILSVFSNYNFQTALSGKISYEVYVEKTRRRILRFLEQSPEAHCLWLEWSGQRFSLGKVLASLDDYVMTVGLCSLSALSPIHGDLCFSNLLYNPRTRNIKIIDPRGEFGLPGINGDPRYDRAKLMHSYSSHYDLIISEQFEVEISQSGSLLCNVYCDEYHRSVGKIFNSVLFRDLADYQQCDSIQALLFLSMLPLHCDKPQRQLAMLFTGLKLYARNFLRGG